MSNADLKIDDRAFVKALKAFTANSRKTSEAVIKDQTRLSPMPDAADQVARMEALIVGEMEDRDD